MSLITPRSKPRTPPAGAQRTWGVRSPAFGSTLHHGADASLGKHYSVPTIGLAGYLRSTKYLVDHHRKAVGAPRSIRRDHDNSREHRTPGLENLPESRRQTMPATTAPSRGDRRTRRIRRRRARHPPEARNTRRTTQAGVLTMPPPTDLPLPQSRSEPPARHGRPPAMPSPRSPPSRAARQDHRGQATQQAQTLRLPSAR